MSKKDILIISVGLVLLTGVIVVSYFFQGSSSSKDYSINIVTDKEEYSAGEILKVKIENNSDEKLCFSSCYPYFIQRNVTGWQDYRYEECEEENVAEKCVDPGQTKAFELTLPKVVAGNHRLLVPACVNCGINDLFKRTKELFSNKFTVK
jgi:hypothetical protein